MGILCLVEYFDSNSMLFLEIKELGLDFAIRINSSMWLFATFLDFFLFLIAILFFDMVIRRNTIFINPSFFILSMGLWNKFKILLKKRFLYKPDAERVDIRLLSIPDWLYKITIKDSKNLSFLCKQTFVDTKEVFTNLNSCIEKIEIREVLSLDVSRYKKDILKNHKLILLSKYRDFLKLEQEKPETVEDYRLFFTELNKQYLILKKAINKSNSILTEFFPGEIESCNSCLESLNEILLKFTDLFAGKNDAKVNSIVSLVREIEEKTSGREKFDKEIDVLDKEISKVRAHIYKLSDKFELLRKSPRFRDVLDKEGKLGKLLEKKDDLIVTMEKKFVPIEVVLYTYAEKVREGALAKEYVTHFAQALNHDLDLEIVDLLKGLDSDLNNKRTKIRKSVGNLKAEQLSSQVVWLIENIKEVRDNFQSIDAEIKKSRAAMRNYIIFNEMEDTESRVEFYQGKLKELLTKRKNKIIEIENLNLLNLKEKLRKELLLVTGYDVHVVYDDD